MIVVLILVAFGVGVVVGWITLATAFAAVRRDEEGRR